MVFSFAIFTLGWYALFLILLFPICYADYSVWDFAPDFANDPIQPYPSLKNPDGTNISIENIAGTRLFGWKGCGEIEVDAIKDAWDDFYKLAQQNSVYKNLDWTSQAATDFWGPGSGEKVIPDNTRAEIKQIFQAAQQMYASLWHSYPPWMWYMYLWIEVRCSDGKTGKSSADPDNKCGDAKPNDGNCPGGSPPNPGGEGNRMEAFADPHPTDNGKYSRITFCNGFFQLNSLTDIVKLNKKQPQSVQNRLDKWNNRARVFFHEVTHLDYFMNAGSGDDKNAKSPYVSDLEINYQTSKTQPAWYSCYGPYNAKVLRNWLTDDPKYIGYFTQRNADNYAWFALANYVQSQIGFYPSSPSPGRKRPQLEPRDAQTQAPPQLGTSAVSDDDLIPGDEQDPPADFTYPGCGDKVEADDVAADAINMSASSRIFASSTTIPTTPTPTFTESLKCHGISGNMWVVSRDVAAQNAIDFCKQTSQSIEYNQGTANDLRLSITNLADAGKPVSEAPDCANTFTNVVLDDCDGNDSVNNPHNYKYGSTYTTSTGWVFKMEPLATQTDDDNCDVSYKFLYDFFEIRGKNFPDAKLRIDGGGLLDQLRGCGDVTGWGFDLTPNDVKYQWYAHGNLPIGTRACVGRAVQSTGGSTAGSCVGSG